MKQSGDASTPGASLPPVIILAGGRSERFGSPKGLTKIGGETLLSLHIASYAKIGSRCVVVLGFYTDPYIVDIERANFQLEGEACIAEYTVNKTFDLGPFSSIQCGLEKLDLDASHGVFIQPVDTGVVSANLYRELFNASENGVYSVIPEWQGRGGHPVFISADLAARLVSIDPTLVSARLDFQMRAEPIAKVRRLSAADAGILVNRNFPTL